MINSQPEAGFMGIWAKVSTWVKTEKGASMVEYALLVVLIAIIAIVAVTIAGKEVSTAFSSIADTLSSN
jgi:pilus assembly protein Flp/PilA